MGKPVAKLIGQNGNVFNLIAICRRALINVGQDDKASEMINRITNQAKSYDEALQIMMDYVDVE